MPAGRKPKPTIIKKLEGNLGHRTLQDELKVPADKVKCPTWVCAEGKKLWRATAQTLIELGLLTNLTAPSFAVLCQNYGRMVDAERKIDDLGDVQIAESGYEQQKPHVSIAVTRAKEFTKSCIEFGLTPSSMTKIAAYTEHETLDESDPMAKVLAGSWK